LDDSVQDVCERLEESNVERMQRQKLTSLPVKTSDGRLVGLLTLRDAGRGGAP
jgi:CBS domain-containing protein